jgi:hypothetical protein
MHGRVKCRTRIYNYRHFTFEYDLDIRANAHGLAHDEPPNHAAHLCRLILKSLDVRQRNRPDNIF